MCKIFEVVHPAGGFGGYRKSRIFRSAYFTKDCLTTKWKECSVTQGVLPPRPPGKNPFVKVISHWYIYGSRPWRD
jgi:hypothetical protein